MATIWKDGIDKNAGTQSFLHCHMDYIGYVIKTNILPNFLNGEYQFIIILPIDKFNNKFIKALLNSIFKCFSRHLTRNVLFFHPGALVPRQSSHYYLPLSDNWWRIIMETCVVLLTGYFIFCEISQIRSCKRRHNSWRLWKMQYMEKDLKFCHPRYCSIFFDIYFLTLFTAPESQRQEICSKRQEFPK